MPLVAVPELANGDAGVPDGRASSVPVGEHLQTSASGGTPGGAVNEHLVLLEGIIDGLSNLDHDLFFQEPVREEDAPRYFEIIKRPMDFGTMRQKV